MKKKGAPFPNFKKKDEGEKKEGDPCLASRIVLHQELCRR
jgi:hypothetical protein